MTHPAFAPSNRLIVVCELCGERIPCERGRAWYEAMDHGIDDHLPWLLSEPGRCKRMFRVVNLRGLPDQAPIPSKPTPS